jgi:organic radical activating enzyme
MTQWLKRIFSPPSVEALPAGIYHYQAPPEAPIPYRLHLRVEPDERGVLIINAATVVHLNPTACAHVLQTVQGASLDEAAEFISRRYRVSKKRARRDQQELRAKILTLATNPDIDPVLFLDMDREEPYSGKPIAPYRLDLALTYATDPQGALDPRSRARVDRELATTEWKQVLDKAWKAGIPHVTFTGGEPLRRADLAELISHAESLGQVTGVLTHGHRLANSNLVEELANQGLDHFLIVRIPGDKENQQGILNALASEVFSAVHLTLEGTDPEPLMGELQWLAEHGAQAVSLSAASGGPQSEAALQALRERAAELDLDLIWDLPAPYSERNPISLETESADRGAGRAWLYVEPDGDVLPAQGVDRILGNILSDPWEEIWRAASEAHAATR